MHEHEHGKAPFEPFDQAAEWDARYSESEAMWSGRPNGRLVSEAANLSPGTALDVGCGEGADAIWLAHRGWTVTAIDISEVAINRARVAADAAGARVEWIRGDVLGTRFQAGSYDLVSLHYPALSKSTGESALGTLLKSVRIGGLLLAVYHDLDEEHRARMREHGHDPADFLGVDDLRRFLDDGFSIEVDAVEPRIDPPPNAPHIRDAVLRARRV